MASSTPRFQDMMSDVSWFSDDLLGRFFTIEEYFDRLRLVPRTG